MQIRREVNPFLLAAGIVFGVIGLFSGAWLVCGGLALIAFGYFLYFFRDPERSTPDRNAIVAGADGRIMVIKTMREEQYLKTEVVRVSIFPSLFDVHVNRAPISGKSAFLGYFTGRHLFTFQEKSSDVNQHNKILIEGDQTRCLVTQIVGPVCRRVVYWLSHKDPTPVLAGDKIGMMKFGSRLDMYFPAADVEILARAGDIVRAGETVIGRYKDANCGMKGVQK